MREITKKNYVQNREQFILDKCRGKKVLHLGCCASPDTETIFGAGNSLFQNIEKICKVQQGLDIDQDAINYLHGKGYKNISFFDLNSPGKVNFEPDIIVFADTLEHLMNLEIALTSMKNLMNAKTELIITVPNATMFPRVVGNFKGFIQENEDHKVSFTYSALKQLLMFNQLKVNNIILARELHIDNPFYLLHPKTYYSKIKRMVYNFLYKGIVFFFPLFSECLIITSSLDKEKSNFKD